MPSGRPKVVLSGHEGTVNELAFSPGGVRLASAGDDGTVRVRNLDGAEPERILRGHSAPVLAVAFSGDDETLASAASDRTIRLWRPSTGDSRVLFDEVTVPSLAFADDHTLIAAGYDGAVRRIDTRSGAVAIVARHEAAVYVVAVGPRGALASGGADGTLQVLVPGVGLYALRGGGGDITGLAFGDDGRVSAASRGHRLRTWNLERMQGVPVGPRALDAWLAGATTATAR
jgi:WD40 repeat protein